MAMAHAKFIKEVQNGKRLDVNELKDLNRQEWNDYKDEILFQDKIYDDYIKNVFKKIQEADEWARDMIEHIENQKDTFNGKFERIDKAFINLYEKTVG